MTAPATLITTIKRLIPPLSGALHKGQAGRIGVVGGSEDYTGAPYFAAISGLKLGADLSHVFCEKHAGTVIKTYSPDLMVHPYLRNTDSLGHPPSSPEGKKIITDQIERVASTLSRLHVLVVGPGLSRDEVMGEMTRQIVERAREEGLPLVIDADGLLLIQSDPELIKGYTLAVLTPNVNEFKKLCESQNVKFDGDHKDTAAQNLSKALGNVTILQKGPTDIISNGKEVIKCDTEGSPRRCGGQGDLLSGACAAFLAWGKNYEAKAWDHPPNPDLDTDFQTRLPLLAAWAASHTARLCSKRAFEERGRSVTTGDMVDVIGGVFGEVWEGEGVVRSQL
ncbi:Ribokinase-like protein [Fimicolochytrium jonesii]|uniref:Ribokinase-like protein n=1 Tax=Fimicolochytrium jonesii TaxID=1396493 RepID=UPI0022FE21A1|nr:Ribokinase-like protein [Fimicolochytrium jonesii]KAI8826256.1 Ribokinase-like protein [Fimicolochytrium jonesii]